jgi:hypothetical protein
VLAAFAVTLMILVPTLRRTAADAAPPPGEIRFLGTPTWVGDSVVAHLGRVASRQVQGTVSGRPLLTGIHGALERSGWFESVTRVQRTASGDIEVEATFLQPIATVHDDFGEVVIGPRGQPLPEGIQMEPGTHVIAIRSPAENRPSRAQRHWPGDDMQAALRLHRLLRGQPWATQIEAIDVSDFDRSGRLILWTTMGTRIVWGAPPGEETPLETLADRKLFRLESGFRTHGRIDMNTPQVLDLTMASHVVGR